MRNQRKNPFPNADKKALLMTLLKVMGGRKVVVSFSGGGDSGSIDSAELLGQDDAPIDLKNTLFEWEREVSFHNALTNEWMTRTEIADLPLSDILVQICEDCLDHTDLDWYNNEGGQGELEIDLTNDPPAINLSVGINYTHTEDHVFNFSDEETEEE